MKHIFIVNPHAGKQSCEALVRTSVAPYQQDYDIEIYVKQHRGDSYEVVLDINLDVVVLLIGGYGCPHKSLA